MSVWMMCTVPPCASRAGPVPDLMATLAPLLRARKDLTEQDVQDLQALFTAAVEQFRSTKADN